MALDNLRHIAESDVYQRYMEVIHCLKSIQYNAVGVVAAKGTYEAENERMKNGLSTSFQVFQAQDQWRQIRYQEVTNIIQLRKNLILLYLADGSMLERRGIGIQ
jgi:outer membrane protein TolC